MNGDTRVLVVEDEVIIAMTAEDMLADLGYAVAFTAASLEEALDAQRRGGFDVAMLDVNLNGELSLPVAARLRDAGRPFIFTTGYGNAGPAEQFPEVEVVRKPYTARDLGEALARALGR